MMDAGCYAAHALRFFPGLQPSVASAHATTLPQQPLIDTAMEVGFRGRRCRQPGRRRCGWLPDTAGCDSTGAL